MIHAETDVLCVFACLWMAPLKVGMVCVDFSHKDDFSTGVMVLF